MAATLVSTPPARPRRRRALDDRGGRLLLRASAALLLLGAGAALGLAVWVTRDLPSLAPLVDYRPALPSVVVDREGRPVAEFYEQRRRLVSFAAVPPRVVDAFLASEDAA